MRAQFAFLLACACLGNGVVGGASGQSEVVNGSGRVVSKRAPFSDFVEVKVGSSFRVDIVQSLSYEVTITADSNVMDLIRVVKVGRTLEIGVEPGYGFRRVTLKAVVKMPDLRRLELSGAAQASLEEFTVTHDLAFALSGASRVEGRISARNLSYQVSGASKVRMQGQGGDLVIQASGASDLQMTDLSVKDADITLSGASEASVDLGGRLKCDLSGASKLYYSGKALVDLDDLRLSGASKIERR